VRPRSFDIVTAFQVIEHERDPLNMMKRIYLLLKKNGTVVLATPNYGGWWSKLMGRRWFGFSHPEHVVLFDFKTMKLLLEKSGFKDIEIRADSPRPFPLSFVFTRSADYFPWASWILRPIGNFLDRFDLKNPINPWDDMIATARK
jgi:SAM-dependent methyltransferase